MNILACFTCFLMVVYCSGVDSQSMVQSWCNITRDSGDVAIPVEGTVELREREDGTGNITIKLDLTGFTGSTGDKHGFHVHAVGDLSNKCVAATGHYNPNNMNHSSPASTKRHVGDLGNIEEEAGGVVTVTLTDWQVTLKGAHSVVNKAIVVHAGEDDLGEGGDQGSITTGNAGGRIACCVISTAEPLVGGSTLNTCNTAVLFVMAAVYNILTG